VNFFIFGYYQNLVIKKLLLSGGEGLRHHEGYRHGEKATHLSKFSHEFEEMAEEHCQRKKL
jgi:hypothetical protein